MREAGSGPASPVLLLGLRGWHRPMRTFQVLEHTGEGGILAHEATAEEVFAEAARGMFSLLVDLDSVKDREVRAVEAEAPT